MCLVSIRIEVRGLPILAFVLSNLAVWCIVAICWQHALGLLVENLGLLPHTLFVAVLGRQ
jgi:hypothetical protein